MGLYAWARNLLPLVGGKTSNPQTRDLVLQLVERYLSNISNVSKTTFLSSFLCD